MAFDYDAMVAVAEELLELFGREVTLQETVVSNANSGTEWRGAGTTGGESITGVNAAFVDFTTQQRAASGGDIKQKDQMVIIAAQSSDITTDWEIDDDGKKWKIVEILNEVKPGPTLVIYILQVRV